ncbi:tyrosine-type recombinase/integrase [Thiomicrorhabdus indica]|uniref:tyrosine-type recombinase/integrase n=1 Tax=Thiomicrorhabdus indica TaxID=2267253 RepID=UPI002AA61A30|nr:tyrosine-type recombinase/integrase [Thiomicrorhabdus indica]
MPLTDPKIKALKYSPKGKKSYSDGKGLNIVLTQTKTGRTVKTWKYISTMQGKSIKLVIGQYPEISIKRAREIHQEARELVAQGIHPRILKAQARADKELNEKRFTNFFNDWMKKQTYKPSTETDLIQRVEKNLSRFLDRKPVNEWTTRELLGVLDRMVQRGAIETARRLAGTLKNVYNDIFLLGIVDSNPAQGLQELLPSKPKAENFGAITNATDLKHFFQSMQEVRPREDYAVTQALRLIPLVFLRPYNIRHLRWDYVDFELDQINIPADDMKRDHPHTVPLSRQAKEILLDMAELTAGNEFVFSTSMGRGKPMSENTTTQAFKRRINPTTGKPYGTGSITSHGFRHTASTLLNEMGFNPDLIEVQLSHLNKDTVRQTYNKAEYLPQRAKMMQAWADYLDSLQNGADVNPIRSQKA